MRPPTVGEDFPKDVNGRTVIRFGHTTVKIMTDMLFSPSTSQATIFKAVTETHLYKFYKGKDLSI